jgi:hypothetical protein
MWALVRGLAQVPLDLRDAGKGFRGSILPTPRLIPIPVIASGKHTTVKVIHEPRCLRALSR